MRTLRVLGLLALAAVPGVADAQLAARQFQVTPRGGFVRYDAASAIKNAGMVGVDAMYNLTPMFAVGAGVSVARTLTNGDDFVSQFRFGDTTFLFAVQQPISILDASVNATARFPLDRFSPFVTAGIGAYKIYMDPQQNAAPKQFSRMSMVLGGGVNVGLGRRSGLTVDLRDLIYTNYNRNRLNPTNSAALVNNRFVEDVPPPPAAKKTLHNIVFSVGFSFTPGIETDTETGAGR